MIASWLRERFRLRLFLPLALFIGVAASPTFRGWRALLLDCGFATLLLAQFRLWDDLADRSADAVAHPERVLVRIPTVTNAIAFCGALAVLNICLAVWRDGSGFAVALLALLDVAFGAWYLARPHAGACPVVPLVKYPALLAVVAGGGLASAPLQIAISAAVLFAVVCAYEAWHDPNGPLARRLSTGGH